MSGRDDAMVLPAEVDAPPPAVRPGRSGRFRWFLAGLLVLVTAINYLDRQTLPVVIGEIQRDILISNLAFARLQALFLVAYGIMYAGGGRFVDLVGTRYGYAIVAGFWSLACAAHALATSIVGLGTARFFLGLGKGGGFPASAKAVAEWFPARERSMAVGVFNTGSAVSAVVAPPLVAGIALAFGWRAVCGRSSSRSSSPTSPGSSSSSGSRSTSATRGGSTWRPSAATCGFPTPSPAWAA